MRAMRSFRLGRNARPSTISVAASSSTAATEPTLPKLGEERISAGVANIACPYVRHSTPMPQPAKAALRRQARASAAAPAV